MWKYVVETARNMEMSNKSTCSLVSPSGSLCKAQWLSISGAYRLEICWKRLEWTISSEKYDISSLERMPWWFPCWSNDKWLEVQEHHFKVKYSKRVRRLNPKQFEHHETHCTMIFIADAIHLVEFRQDLKKKYTAAMSKWICSRFQQDFRNFVSRNLSPTPTVYHFGQSPSRIWISYSVHSMTSWAFSALISIILFSNQRNDRSSMDI